MNNSNALHTIEQHNKTQIQTQRQGGFYGNNGIVSYRVS
jgi:hypothetical protein